MSNLLCMNMTNELVWREYNYFVYHPQLQGFDGFDGPPGAPGRPVCCVKMIHTTAGTDQGVSYSPNSAVC